MFKVIIFAACVLVVKGQYGYPPTNEGAPNPYQFAYSSPAIGGSSSHQESGDGQGRVQGSYSVTDDDGRTRTVEYVADENGYRANIVTNEPGTSNQAPADVTISSSADQGAGESVAYAPAPVSYAPAPVAYAPAAYGGPLAYGGAPVAYGGAPVAYGGAPVAYGGPIAYGGAPEVIPYGY